MRFSIGIDGSAARRHSAAVVWNIPCSGGVYLMTAAHLSIGACEGDARAWELARESAKD
jgi:hypothetical protein